MPAEMSKRFGHLPNRPEGGSSRGTSSASLRRDIAKGIKGLDFMVRELAHHKLWSCGDSGDAQRYASISSVICVPSRPRCGSTRPRRGTMTGPSVRSSRQCWNPSDLFQFLVCQGMGHRITRSGTIRRLSKFCNRSIARPMSRSARCSCARPRSHGAGSATATGRLRKDQRFLV